MPFTEFEEESGLGEVQEKPRGEGIRRAVGELLSCPFCVSQWIALFLVGGFYLAPKLTRAVAAMFAAKALADVLQISYDKAKESVT